MTREHVTSSRLKLNPFHIGYAVTGIGAMVSLWVGLHLLQSVTASPQEIIQAQLTALKREDFAEAYSYLNRNLKERYAAEEFRRMIVGVYSPFVEWRGISIDSPRAVIQTFEKIDFPDIGQIDMSQYMRSVGVIVMSRDDVETLAYFTMARETTGWKVAGVTNGRAVQVPWLVRPVWGWNDALEVMYGR